jgi:hypothetical protein
MREGRTKPREESHSTYTSVRKIRTGFFESVVACEIKETMHEHRFRTHNIKHFIFYSD